MHWSVTSSKARKCGNGLLVLGAASPKVPYLRLTTYLYIVYIKTEIAQDAHQEADGAEVDHRRSIISTHIISERSQTCYTYVYLVLPTKAQSLQRAGHGILPYAGDSSTGFDAHVGTFGVSQLLGSIFQPLSALPASPDTLIPNTMVKCKDAIRAVHVTLRCALYAYMKAHKHFWSGFDAVSRRITGGDLKTVDLHPDLLKRQFRPESTMHCTWEGVIGDEQQ
jgi:hypothetical protein